MADEEAGVRGVPIRQYGNEQSIRVADRVAVEEPLQIRLIWPGGERNVAITMRTPGNDTELALGFLMTEGVIAKLSDIVRVDTGIPEVDHNLVLVSLATEPDLVSLNIERNFFMSSSCGICGKASVEAIRTRSPYQVQPDGMSIDPALLIGLPEKLMARQKLFAGTGSIHAAALFSSDGLENDIYEDVGRHNAVDKLLGAAFGQGRLPLDRFGLLVSGRVSFELVQKARMAGCPMVAAVGAPSSLAIDLAWDAAMTLIGFVRDGRFNVYTCPDRLSGLS